MRPLLLALLVVFAPTLRGASAAGDWNRVTIPPLKTSIYVGSVTLTPGILVREGHTLSTTYEAKVFPWIFWGETGRITIQLTEAALAGLARGEVVDFTGEALNHKSKPRSVSARAYPADAHSGKVKIRIRVDDTELIFNGTYQLSQRDVIALQ